MGEVNAAETLSSYSNADKHNGNLQNEKPIGQSNQNTDNNEPKTFIQKSRYTIGKFVNSNIIEAIIIGMILINGIMIGLSTFDFVSLNPQLHHSFDIADMAFLIIFTVELLLHFYHLGPVKIFQNGWITFDLILVVVSWIFNTGTFKALRALRILRVLPRVEALKHVITSVVTVLPKMGTVALLMMLIMFIFSILMTQLFG